MKYKEKTSCRVCGSTDLKMILDLKDQPLANAYHKPEEELETYVDNIFQVSKSEGYSTVKQKPNRQ